MKTLGQNLRSGFVIVLVVSSFAAHVSGQNLTVLHSFSSQEGSPYASLTEGNDGVIYGTTFMNNSTTNGMIFRLAADGSLVKLVAFPDTNNCFPIGGLVQANDGYFYGAASPPIDSGKFGIVYRMTADGTLTTLAVFNGTNGGLCYVPLTVGRDGNIYGTTFDASVYYNNNGNGWGSSKGGNGTVFKMTPEGILTTLVSFNGTNGSRPNGVIQASDGNFYGTTLGGGDYNLGTVFKLTPEGAFTNLVSFAGTNGENPTACVVQGHDGNLYGSTALSTGQRGSVFKLTTNGVMTTLVQFNGTNGGFPNASLICGSDGNLYGTTDQGGNLSTIYGHSGVGTIFRVTPDGDFATLVAFDGTNGGFPEQIPVMQARNGLFYGMTVIGGTANGGVIYQLDLSPKLLAITKAGPAEVTLTWSAITNLSYQLQIKTNLNDTNWVETGLPITATGNIISTTNGVGTQSSFFRVKLLP